MLKVIPINSFFYNWGYSSGGVYVPCIYMHARRELPLVTQVFVVICVLCISMLNLFRQHKQTLYKNSGSEAAVTDRAYYWGENRIFYKLVPSDVALKTTNYSSKFRFGHQDTENQQRWWTGDRKISHGKGSQGHWCLLQLKWTLTELWTWNWQGCCHVVYNQFWTFNVPCIALLVKQGSFLI